MFTSVGVAASAGVAAALIIGVSIMPTILVQWRGTKWRMGKQAQKYEIEDQQSGQKV